MPAASAPLIAAASTIASERCIEHYYLHTVRTSGDLHQKPRTSNRYRTVCGRICVVVPYV
eukprot:3585667-Pleurochrysis_carterae.AAC.1